MLLRFCFTNHVSFVIARLLWLLTKFCLLICWVRFFQTIRASNLFKITIKINTFSYLTQLPLQLLGNKGDIWRKHWIFIVTCDICTGFSCVSYSVIDTDIRRVNLPWNLVIWKWRYSRKERGNKDVTCRSMFHEKLRDINYYHGIDGM